MFVRARLAQYGLKLKLLHTGKIGYGTVSEALAYKLPFVFVRRDYFNEEPFLRNMLEVHFLVVIEVLFSHHLLLCHI